MAARSRTSWMSLALSLALAFPVDAAERSTPPPRPPAVSNPVAPTNPAFDIKTTLPGPAASPGQAAGSAAILGAAELGPSPSGPPVSPTVPGVAPRTELILNDLAPENSAKVGDEQVSALAASLVDPSLRVSGGAGPVRASNAPASPATQLAPWQRDSEPGRPAIPGRRPGSATPQPTLAERLHYQRLWVGNLWFYVYTNIRNKWGPYLGYWRKLRDSGVPPVVSRPREFFAGLRVFGETGYFRVQGFTPLEDAEVLAEARAVFAKYFDGPGIGDKERAAFEGFLQRAVVFNAKRRAASKFRANARDNMLKASTMTPDKIAPFFDGLPITAKTDEFQANGTADAILAQFKETALAAIAEEPREAKDRVTGVILIGSFALGAATPKSDFDIEPITADGTSGRVRAFAEKVTARWAQAGRQKANPVTFHYFGYLNSRWEIRAIHPEPYIIISPDQSIVDNLALRPGEPPAHVPSRKRTFFGDVLRRLQYGAVYATSLITPAKPG